MNSLIEARLSIAGHPVFVYGDEEGWLRGAVVHELASIIDSQLGEGAAQCAPAITAACALLQQNMDEEPDEDFYLQEVDGFTLSVQIVHLSIH